MKKNTLKCYMCEEDAVGNEHVPPRCLFPKSKDIIQGKNFRVNLLTVPSCELHNSEKSEEDQYFLNVLTSCAQINSVGREHYRNQIRRQNLRNPSLISRFAERAIEFNGALGHEIEIHRLDNLIAHLAFALYYSHFLTKWYGGVDWFPEFLARHPVGQAENMRLEVIKENDRMFSNIIENGSNPEVFKYQVLEEGHVIKMRLSFYGGCKILLTYKNSD